MEAIILAAGKGSRISKAINKNKCLIKVSNKTLIDRIIYNLRRYNIEKIFVLIGFNQNKIKQKLKNKSVNFIYNKYYFKTEMLDTLILGLKCCQEDVIITYSDIIYDHKVIKQIHNFRKKKNNFLIPVLSTWRKIWKIKNKDIFDDAETLKFSKKKELLEIGKKITNINEVMAQYMGIIYIPHKKIKYFISQYNKLKNKKIHLTKFINILIKKKQVFKCIKTNHHWYEFDDYIDILNYKKNFRKNVS